MAVTMNFRVLKRSIVKFLNLLCSKKHRFDPPVQYSFGCWGKGWSVPVGTSDGIQRLGKYYPDNRGF